MLYQVVRPFKIKGVLFQKGTYFRLDEEDKAQILLRKKLIRPINPATIHRKLTKRKPNQEELNKEVTKVCPAKDKNTGLCYGKAYFEGKAEKPAKCDIAHCSYKEAISKQANKKKDARQYLEPKSSCYCCKGKVFWQPVEGGRWRCKTCHPPAVDKWIEYEIGKRLRLVKKVDNEFKEVNYARSNCKEKEKQTSSQTGRAA